MQQLDEQTVADVETALGKPTAAPRISGKPTVIHLSDKGPGALALRKRSVDSAPNRSATEWAIVRRALVAETKANAEVEALNGGASEADAAVHADFVGNQIPAGAEREWELYFVPQPGGLKAVVQPTMKGKTWIVSATNVVEKAVGLDGFLSPDGVQVVYAAMGETYAEARNDAVNRTIMSVLHQGGVPDYVAHDNAHWLRVYAGYQEIAERHVAAFQEFRAQSKANRNALAMVHDTQLMLSGKAFKAAGINAGYFHHSPFMPNHKFVQLPLAQRMDILANLAAFNHVVVHTPEWERNLSDCYKSHAKECAQLGIKVPKIRVFQATIDRIAIYEEEKTIRTSDGVLDPITKQPRASAWDRVHDAIAASGATEQTTIVAMLARMDPFKGFVSGLLQYEAALHADPSLIESSRFMFAGEKTRNTHEANAYKEMCEFLVERINAYAAEVTGQSGRIQIIRTDTDHGAALALMEQSDVFWVNAAPGALEVTGDEASIVAPFHLVTMSEAVGAKFAYTDFAGQNGMLLTPSMDTYPAKDDPLIQQGAKVIARSIAMGRQLKIDRPKEIARAISEINRIREVGNNNPNNKVHRPLIDPKTPFVDLPWTQRQDVAIFLREHGISPAIRQAAVAQEVAILRGRPDFYGSLLDAAALPADHLAESVRPAQDIADTREISFSPLAIAEG